MTILLRSPPRQQVSRPAGRACGHAPDQRGRPDPRRGELPRDVPAVARPPDGPRPRGDHGRRRLDRRQPRARRAVRLRATGASGSSRQPNGGLGSARNTGRRASPAASSSRSSDSDDVRPAATRTRGCSARSTRTGSDFATGNVQRLTRQGASQAQFLARTFARTRRRTHVSRCRPLLADRTAWNKLWRRSFWDAHGFRFPEGVVHEDIPVTLPAHVAARSVDVLAAPGLPVARCARTGRSSITAAPARARASCATGSTRSSGSREHLALHGVRHAVALVRGQPRRRRPAPAPRPARRRRRAYRGAVHGARRTRCSRARRGGSSRRCPAIERLKWQLVRARAARRAARGAALPEARRRGAAAGARAAAATTATTRSATDRGAAAPALDLPARPPRRGPRADRPAGRRAPDGNRLRARAVTRRSPGSAPRAAPGSGRRSPRCAPAAGAPLRLRLAGVRLPTAPARRPDLPRRPRVVGLRGRARPGALRRRGRWEAGTWDLYAGTCVGLLRRRRARFVLASPELIGAVDLPAGADACVRAAVTADGALRVEVRTRWARLRERRVSGGRARAGRRAARGRRAGDARPAPPQRRAPAPRRGRGRGRAVPRAPPARRAARRARLARGRRGHRRPGRARAVGPVDRRPPACGCPTRPARSPGRRAATTSRSSARARRRGARDARRADRTPVPRGAGVRAAARAATPSRTWSITCTPVGRVDRDDALGRRPPAGERGEHLPLALLAPRARRAVERPCRDQWPNSSASRCLSSTQRPVGQRDRGDVAAPQRQLPVQRLGEAVAGPVRPAPRLAVAQRRCRRTRAGRRRRRAGGAGP